MNPSNNHASHMHFKAAQISAAELSPNDMAMINSYALSPLEPEEVFAFKVSMAGNELDRDFEVFPYATLQRFASLFVGKTVIKDHQHVSDNQIARIYATNLVQGEPMRMTKMGEVYTELIAKCYMIKTASNADLVAEIQAGIRKEVSLGCRIGKAVCSICGKDNVKSYCSHFPGKEYKGETCYFSLENPTDAYELSFVAIPAQHHAGTVKAYGDKPCSAAEMTAKDAGKSAEQADDLGKRLTVNQVQEQVQNGSVPSATELNHEEDPSRLTVNQVQDEVQKGSAPHPTDLNPDGGQQGDEGEVTSKALDSFAEKLKHMRERLDALGESLEKIEATILEITGKGLDNMPSEAQEAPVPEGNEAAEQSERLTVNQVQDEVQEGSATSATGLNHEEDQGRLSVNQVQEQVQNSSAVLATGLNHEEGQSRLTVNQVQDGEQDGSEPPATELNPEQDCAGYEPAITFADDQETQEQLKAKQAQARLRALELGLSIRTHA